MLLFLNLNRPRILSNTVIALLENLLLQPGNLFLLLLNRES